MQISKLKIENYRLLKELDLDLEKKISLIIGKNNCGKTSFLSILNKFIGNQATRNNFSWDDFSLDFQDILKDLVLESELNKEEKKFPMGIALNIFIEYNETDDLSNISSIMMDLNPDNNTVIIEFQYSISIDSFYELKKDYAAYSKKMVGKRRKQEESSIVKKVNNDFLDYMKSEYRKYFKITKYSREFDLEKKQETELRVPIISDKIIDRIINFKFISAIRTVSNSDTNNTLSILSSEYYKNIEENEKQQEAIESFKDVIGDTDKKLDQIYENLFSGVIGKVKKFGGIKDGDSVIKILSSLQRRELLKGNTTVMYDHGNYSMLPESYNGLGYLNLIGMIFEIEVILAEFRKDGKDNEKPADINLFFIEEPEAHTHPQMQYVFINNIKDILRTGCQDKNGNEIIDMQTIITTHSSHIVSESKFEDLKYFYITDSKYVNAKNIKDLEVEYKKDDEGEQRFKFLKQYLTLNRSELFFADKAIFIEGDTERILLPAMMKKIDQLLPEETAHLLSQNISIVEVGAYSHIFDKFIDFIGLKSLIITDIDPAKIEICLDEKGEPKLNKDETQKKKIVGCRADAATTTTNAALKFFFSSQIGASKTNESEDKPINCFDELCKLPFEKKSLIRIITDTENFKWIASDLGKIKVVFQSNEKDDREISYQACSFEDAFIHLNRKFLIDNLSEEKMVFNSLIKKSLFEDYENNALNLASSCIDKKTSFAMEILLASDLEDENNHYSNWKTPAYIKEGLEWLQVD